MTEVPSLLESQTPQNLWLTPVRELELKKLWMERLIDLRTGTQRIDDISSEQDDEAHESQKFSIRYKREKTLQDDGQRARISVRIKPRTSGTSLGSFGRNGAPFALETKGPSLEIKFDGSTLFDFIFIRLSMKIET